MSCVLISKSVFEKIEKPYFFPIPEVGEDLSFCYKVKEAGIKMYCDTTIQFGHVAHVEIVEDNFKKALIQLKEQNKTVEEVQL
jgi:predicted peroxiredoxin